MKGTSGTLKSLLLPVSLLLLPLVADRAESVGEGAGVEAAHVAALLLRARLLVHLGVFGINGYRFKGFGGTTDDGDVLHVKTEEEIMINERLVDLLLAYFQLTWEPA